MRYSNSKEYRDPFYIYTAFIDVPFEDIPLEGIFTYNGTVYVKRVLERHSYKRYLVDGFTLVNMT